MKLGQFFRGVPSQNIGADQGERITSLAYDSRQVKPGSLFFAIQGEKADGHSFIPQALQQGAVAIVSEREAPAGFANRWVRVDRIRRALAQAGQVFYGQPDSRLRLVGITGTNGKTTTSYLTESIF